MTKLIIFLFVFICMSCAFFISPKVRYTIENRTSKDMNILVYSKAILLNAIAINKQSKFDTTRGYPSPGSNGQTSPFDYEKVDSIVVLFSDKKAIKYYCNGERLLSGTASGLNCKWDKSPMDFNYEKADKLKPITYKSLIYDESDYQKAKPL